MPGIEKRVVVTPSPSTGPLLTALSEALGKPRATIVRELLDEAAPALQVMLEAVRVLKTRPEAAQAAMARLATSSINQLTQAQIDFDKALSKRPGPKPRKKPRKGAAPSG